MCTVTSPGNLFPDYTGLPTLLAGVFGQGVGGSVAGCRSDARGLRTSAKSTYSNTGLVAQGDLSGMVTHPVMYGGARHGMHTLPSSRQVDRPISQVSTA